MLRRRRIAGSSPHHSTSTNARAQTRRARRCIITPRTSIARAMHAARVIWVFATGGLTDGCTERCAGGARRGARRALGATQTSVRRARAATKSNTIIGGFHRRGAVWRARQTATATTGRTATAASASRARRAAGVATGAGLIAASNARPATIWRTRAGSDRQGAVSSVKITDTVTMESTVWIHGALRAMNADGAARAARPALEAAPMTA